MILWLCDPPVVPIIEEEEDYLLLTSMDIDEYEP